MSTTVAVGEVEVLYHDLKIDVVDKNTHKQDLSRLLESAVNSFKLRRDNPRSAKTPALSIAVRRPRPPDVSFFRLLWSNIRYGLVTTLGS